MSENIQHSRSTYLDAAKAVGIFLVISCHVIFDASPYWEEIAAFHTYTRLIYSFHMPLFFFISGMLMIYENESFRVRLRRDFDSLIMPYVVWSIIYLLLFFAGGDSILGRGYAFVTGRGMAPLWFLSALFLSKALFRRLNALISKNTNQGWVVLCILLMLSLVSWTGYCHVLKITHSGLIIYPVNTIVRSTVGALFVSAGHEFAVAYSRAGEKRLITLAALILAASSFIVANIYHLNNSNMHTLEFDSLPLFLFTGISGSVMLIMLCKLTDSRMTILTDIGKHTMNMMIIHYKPIPLTAIVVFLMSCLIGDSLICVVVDIIVIYFLSYLIAKLIDRTIANKKGIEAIKRA